MYNHLFLLNLLSLLQDFDRIVLDEAVLGVARMFQEELVVMPHDEDYNRSNSVGLSYDHSFIWFFVGIWENHFGLAIFFYQFNPPAIQF
jgi:hypothetical protein